MKAATRDLVVDGIESFSCFLVLGLNEGMDIWMDGCVSGNRSCVVTVGIVFRRDRFHMKICTQEDVVFLSFLIFELAKDAPVHNSGIEGILMEEIA